MYSLIFMYNFYQKQEYFYNTHIIIYETDDPEMHKNNMW